MPEKPSSKPATMMTQNMTDDVITSSKKIKENQTHQPASCVQTIFFHNITDSIQYYRYNIQIQYYRLQYCNEELL